MSFKIKDIEKGDEFVPTLRPGVHELEILGVNLVPAPAEGKADDFIVHFMDLNKNGEFFFHNYLSPKAMKFNLIKAEHIISKTMSQEEQDKISAETERGLLENMYKAVVGRKIRMRLDGEEFVKTEQDGSQSIKVKTIVGFPIFAESIEVDKANSVLSYDENNKWHYRKLDPSVREAVESLQQNAQNRLDNLNV